MRCIVLALILLLALCVSPYVLLWSNNRLNTLFGIIDPSGAMGIQSSDYLNYMAAFPAGVLAVVISVLALRVARKTICARCRFGQRCVWQ